MGRNAAWLAQIEEEAIEPDLRICDAHHHFWSHREGTVEPRYLHDELLLDLNTGHNIVSTVYIELKMVHRAGATLRQPTRRARASRPPPAA